MINIRPITPEDHQTLIDIKKRSILACRTDYPENIIQQWLTYCEQVDINTYFQGQEGFIAEYGGQDVGFALYTLSEPYGRISGMFVAKEHASQGIGSQLFQKTEQEVKKQGHTRIHIRATFNAQPFYEKFGYTFTKEGISRAGFPISLMDKYL